MKRRILTALTLCTVLLLSSLSLFGCGETRDIYVLSDDKTYYICNGNDTFNQTELEIKSEINGLPVKEISELAFYGNETLKKVTIPDSVTKIGKSAFQNCSALNEVTIGSGVKTVSESAFEHCQNLTTVVLSDNVTKISKNAFKNCIKLSEINLPDCITTIGESAFAKCKSLKTVVLPAELTKLDSKAFEDCIKITSLTINKKLEKIGDSSFKNCLTLTTINFATDGALEIIGGSAFWGCSSIAELTFPDSVKGILSSAFYNCKGLRKVTFGKGINYIGGSIPAGTFVDDDTSTIHIEEMIFPEEAIGYGWYPTLSEYQSIRSRSYWGGEGYPGDDDLFFLTPEEIRNNEARVQLAQTMGGYAWAKCIDPNPDRAV